jgi:hypothetical protein
VRQTSLRDIWLVALGLAVGYGLVGLVSARRREN